MPIPSSERTEQLAAALFSEPECSRILARLINEASENIPFCEHHTPEGMERIRFAIMKLISENPKNEEMAFDCAKTDWRDLFVAAGFGYSATEHENWFAIKTENNSGCDVSTD